ncbi:thioredoxin fold domain-containing protein [Nitratireductor sp. CAU 1489]|uniref:Thioredoxin fold domain-containing protein n=1 Tax=Nitratireductor arenosus TaxID=2682096 RepID=A0A844QPV2_9HYPH|nr:thioredoxin family protein [Nitratireductor arenosus]MVA99609.1 thioredoxin fold domain-containing protein [Nitratireductor arenosus]
MPRFAPVRLAALLTFLLAAAGPAHTDALLPEPELGDNGLHVQDWFLQSFLDIGDDFATAQDAGKGLVIVFEQSGCPYCREMHRVNLRDPEIVRHISDNFDVLQLDLRGSRAVTDTDGEELPERDLARKWGVVFTPTLIFVPREADPNGKPAKQAAAAVMPGYFKPFHFASMFAYVASGAYRDHHFQDFITARADALRKDGKEVTIWD